MVNPAAATLGGAMSGFGFMNQYGNQFPTMTIGQPGSLFGGSSWG